MKTHLLEMRRYGYVLFLALCIVALEILGGIWSGSLALLADAGHVVVDSGAALVSIAVVYSISKGFTEHTTRKVGGMINAFLLMCIAGWIFVEALHRIHNPGEILGIVMVVVSSIGALLNYVQHRILHAAHEHHITHSAMHLHVLSDLIMSIGVVASSIIIMITGWTLIDPLLSFVIAGVIGFWSLRLLTQVLTDHDNSIRHH